MLDIANIIYTYLSNSTPYWLETNPALSSLIFTFDEFDLKSPSLQILLENMPDKKTWVREDLQKIEHQCRITIFVKPIPRIETGGYDEGKTQFLNMKSEIDRIILKYMFNISDNVTLSGWDDSNTLQVGRGTKNFRIIENEMKSDNQDPNIFQSKQIVTCFYYQYISNVDPTNVPIRVYQIQIGKTGEEPYTWTGITDAKWEDNDPWVMIEIPGGPMVHQHLHPVHIKGEILVRDMSPMGTALFSTAIDTSDHMAVESDGKKWSIDVFNISVTTSNGLLTAVFDNTKIQTISFDRIELGQDNMIRIKFMADMITYTFPSQPGNITINVIKDGEHYDNGGVVIGSESYSDGEVASLSGGTISLGVNIPDDTFESWSVLGSNITIDDPSAPDTYLNVLGGDDTLTLTLYSCEVGHWHINEGTGVLVSDSTTFNRDGTYSDLLNPGLPPTWVAGKLGSALHFNSSQIGSVSCGNVTKFDLDTPFSVEFWFWLDSSKTEIQWTGIFPLVSKETGTPFKGWVISLMDGSSLNIILCSNLDTADAIYLREGVVGGMPYGAFPLWCLDSQWHHLVMTYDGSANASGVKLYIDNVLRTPLVIYDDLTASILNTEPLRFGSNSLTHYLWYTKLDEIVIYNRVLLNTEVSTRWNSGAGTETPIC